jgi:hypothetical protein
MHAYHTRPLRTKLRHHLTISLILFDSGWPSKSGVGNNFFHSGDKKVKKVKLSLSLTNYALRHEGVWRSGCIHPRFLDLGTSWRWVVSFTPWSLYPRGKSPRYPLDRRLGGPQSRPGQYREETIFTIPRLELRPLGRTARSQWLYRLIAESIGSQTEKSRKKNSVFKNS